MIFSKALKYACAIALVIATSVPAGATTFPAAGGPGTAVELKCGANEYLVGFKGRTGNWVDEIRPLCATISSDGTRGPVTDDDGFAGGMGGSRSEFTCPTDSYIAATRVYVRSNLYVTSIHFICYRPRDNEQLKETVKFGVQTLPGVSQGWKECPGDEIGKGVNVRFGKYVNALGLMCETLSIPKEAPVASTKPKPAPSTSTASSGPPSMSSLSFSGAWKVVTSEGRQYTLVLNPMIPGTLMPGQQITFNGQFVSTDGARQFNGSLQGVSTYPAPMLNFQYGQPGLESGGTGFFTVNSDGQLFGTVLHNGKDKIAWAGGRNSVPPTPAAPAASKSSSASSSETSAPTATSTLEEQTDRPGDDYSQTVSDDPVKCRAKCLKDKSCAAWTWVQEGVQGDKGQCYLKDRVPSARPGDCCVSGVITR